MDVSARQGHALVYWHMHPTSQLLAEYVRTNFRLIFVSKHKLCSDYGLPNCITMENKSAILESLTELDSLIFEEYEMRLGSLPNRHETEYINLKLDYDALKTKLIDTFSRNTHFTFKD